MQIITNKLHGLKRVNKFYTFITLEILNKVDTLKTDVYEYTFNIFKFNRVEEFVFQSKKYSQYFKKA